MSLNQTQLNSLSEQQQQTTDQINKLVSQSTDALTCGPNCQKTRTANSLQQTYLNAQANVETAPSQLQEAEKNYYTFTQGTAGYNAVQRTTVTEQAATATNSATTTFQNGVDSATTLTTTYNSLSSTYQNAFELYKKYLEENAELQGEINEINTDTVTNDRKTYYESQGYSKLQSWYTLFKWIYILLLIVYVIGLFLLGSSFSFISKIGILFALILYPFVINYIVMVVYNGLRRVYSLLPKNAYTTLQKS
jgi:hypothetical protein